MGKGIFKDDFPIIGVHLVRLYYVLMGASVGANVKVKISTTTFRSTRSLA